MRSTYVDVRLNVGVVWACDLERTRRRYQEKKQGLLLATVQLSFVC